MKIKAVLFDCDGLMFNTEVLSQNMWRKEAEKNHTVIPDGFFSHITGARSDAKALADYPDTPHLKEVCAAMKKKRFDLSYWTSFSPDGLNKEGLLALYQYLEDHHIKKAVASSSSVEYLQALIGTVSVPLHFDALIGGDLVKKGKPDPEIFLKAAAAVHEDPQYCLVLEDSKQGILAAKAAGMHSCFIQDTIVPDEEMKRALEFQKDNLEEVIELLQEGENNGI